MKSITDASLGATNSVYSGIDWIDAIRDANIRLFNKDVPDDMPRFLAVTTEIFDAIKYAKDSNGQYLVLNRDFKLIQPVVFPHALKLSRLMV